MTARLLSCQDLEAHGEDGTLQEEIFLSRLTALRWLAVGWGTARRGWGIRAALRPIAIVASLGLSSLAWGQGTAPKPLPDDQAGRCRYGAEHMIEFGKQGLTEPGSRPEEVEKRRKLLEEWTRRLEQGEDPCAVYMDIQKAATTF